MVGPWWDHGGTMVGPWWDHGGTYKALFWRGSILITDRQIDRILWIRYKIWFSLIIFLNFKTNGIVEHLIWYFKTLQSWFDNGKLCIFKKSIQYDKDSIHSSCWMLKSKCNFIKSQVIDWKEPIIKKAMFSGKKSFFLVIFLILLTFVEYKIEFSL